MHTWWDNDDNLGLQEDKENERQYKTILKLNVTSGNEDWQSLAGIHEGNPHIWAWWNA